MKKRPLLLLLTTTFLCFAPKKKHIPTLQSPSGNIEINIFCFYKGKDQIAHMINKIFSPHLQYKQKLPCNIKAVTFSHDEQEVALFLQKKLQILVLHTSTMHTQIIQLTPKISKTLRNDFRFFGSPALAYSKDKNYLAVAYNKIFIDDNHNIKCPIRFHYVIILKKQSEHGKFKECKVFTTENELCHAPNKDRLFFENNDTGLFLHTKEKGPPCKKRKYKILTQLDAIEN